MYKEIFKIKLPMCLREICLKSKFVEWSRVNYARKFILAGKCNAVKSFIKKQ